MLCAVVFVNGFTDAPNAIVNCVATGCLPLRKASLMAAVFNLLGVVFGFAFAKELAFTVGGLVDFYDTGISRIALSSALGAIVIWAVSAWFFGIPTSESHALAAGLAGAALASGGADLGKAQWIKLFAGLILSVFAGYILGKFTNMAVKKANLNDNSHSKFQIYAAAATAFMHGSQDGLKFLGVFMLISGGKLPVYTIFICAGLMACGTFAGGRRIIENVGIKMVNIEKYQGVAADIASSICLLAFTLAGIPVSTTHTKTSALMGCGHEGMNKKIALSVVTAWIVTFPCCGAISFLLTKLILGLK